MMYILLEDSQRKVHDYWQEAARQRLARIAVRSSPTYGLERTYYLTQGLFWLATALPAALLVLLAQNRGVTLGQIGLLFGAYALTAAVCEVPSGMLADAWGRKRTALLAYTLMIAAQTLLIFAFSLPLLLVWALLYGVGRALVSGALEAWFVDEIERAAPGTNVQPLFAKVGTVELLALTLGTLLGGVLPKLFTGLPEGAVLSPLSAVLLVSVGVKVILVGVVLWGVKETLPEKTSHTGFRKLFSNTFKLSHRNPALRLLFGSALAGGFALAGLETFWQPRFADLLGPDTVILSVILAGSFGVGMLGNLASIPLCRLFAERYARVAALMQGLGGLTLIVLALQTRALPAVLLFWLVYLTLGVSGSPRQTLLNRAVPSDARAALLSVSSLMTYVGFFVGSVILGRLAEQVSVSAAWGVAGVVFALSLRFYVGLERLSTEKTARASTL